jgi:N-acetylmuramoyl-L-alanine amidase
MNINRRYITVNPFSRPGNKRPSTEKVVWHYTANPGATAYGHALYFDSLKNQDPGDDVDDRYASAHTFIDRYGIFEIIPLAERAYHAGNGVMNWKSIGVELCIEKDGSFHPETIKLAVEYGAYLAKTYKFDPLKDFIRHFDVTGKICPKRWVDHPEEFLQFKENVKDMIAPKPTYPMSRSTAKLIIDKYLKPAYGEAKTQLQRDIAHNAANKIRFLCGAKEDEQL